MSKGNPWVHIVASVVILSVAFWVVACAKGQDRESGQRAPDGGAKRPLPDAVQDAQTPQPAAAKRPEQQKTQHDNDAAAFSADAAPPSSIAFKTQPDEGKVKGF